MKKLHMSFAGLLISLWMPLSALAGAVNINTADAELLSQELIGVGLSKAQAIVEYRNQYGRFEAPEELVKVKGIGPRVLAANSENIRIED
jgi:competence protein ComEA